MKKQDPSSGSPDEAETNPKPRRQHRVKAESQRSEVSITTMDYAIPSREDILTALRNAPAPLMAEELALDLGVKPEEREGFERRLSAMERDGQLMPNRKGVLLLATKLDFVAGRVTGHRDGFGFLIRDDGGPDLWLSPKEMLKVLHGDRVLVKATGTDFRGKPECVIVEVTERRTNRLVGRLLNERGVFVVAPEDQRIKHDILIPPGEIHKAQPGQVVMVEIIEQPSRYTQPIGRIAEVLGEIDDPGMEIEIAVRKFDVPHIFSPAALKQADSLPDVVRSEDLLGRVDLRDVPLVTIDGEDARDFDDAVYAEPMEGKQGGWRLLVAIADVSHYVTPGAALDKDAFERSTSVYFPRRVIPMLPEKISNGLCSLNPMVDRLVLVCDMVVSEEGEVSAYQFYNAVMHSAARFTYTEVWNILTAPDGPAGRARGDLVPGLQTLHDLYKAFVKARNTRGAIDFETTETYIVCNTLGKIEQIVPRTRNDAHKLIEECMLSANVCAADFMLRSKHNGLFRVHDGPTVDKLNNLRTFLKTLGLSLSGGDSPHSSDYAALAERVKSRPDAPLLQTMMLRSMQQAIYSPDNGGHFGLAYEGYAHFTSPIRRYPDLLTHRVIKALLASRIYLPSLPGSDGPGSSLVDSRGKRAFTPEQVQQQHQVWEQFGMQCSANERRADDASRDVEAWLKCYFMREKVGEEFRGTISGVAQFGVFVTLDTLYVDGLVHISELGTDYFQFNEALRELRGERTGQRFRLTDPVTVQVSRVDLEARKIEFRLVRGNTYQQIMRGVLPEADASRKPAGRGKETKAKDGKSGAKRAVAPMVPAEKDERPAKHPRGKAPGKMALRRKR
jgi:ribonuclease R